MNQNMTKHFANIITTLRIIASVVLLFFSFPSCEFYIIYLFCGLTDMIDGTIARKLHAVSSFGSKLDSVADFVFMVVCSIKLLSFINLHILLWIWITFIAFIKIINIILGFVKSKKLIALHTILNKATGLLLFLLPLTLQFIDPIYSFAVVCIIATIAAIQECYCIIKINNNFILVE